MSRICACLTMVVVLLISQGVVINAKRGCSAFGHSCFGGHGKRSSNPLTMEPSSPEMLQRQLGQEETPPHPGYPRSYNLPTGDDIIPVRDGGVLDRDDTAARELMKFKLRNIVKHWMDSYRRSQNNDGYIVENL